MLTATLVKRLKAIGRSIATDQDKFLAILNDALEALYGKEWKEGDLPVIFKQLEKEIYPPLCVDEDGPRVSRDTFRNYFGAAKKSLLFEVPFKMAHRVSADDLPTIKQTVAADKSKRPTEAKLKDAIKALRLQRKRIPEPIKGIHIPFPSKQEGDAWVETFFQKIDEILSDPAMSRIMRGRYRQDLQRLLLLCRRPVPAEPAG